MSYRWFVLVGLSLGIASPQTILPDVQKYLKLTDAQVTSINDLNVQFQKFNQGQQTAYYKLQSAAYSARAQEAPDAGAVGDAFAQMEMLRRAYNNQLTEVQGKVAAVLTGEQKTLVNALLAVERMQPLVAEAHCVYLQINTVPTGAERAGDFSRLLLGTAASSSFGSTPCWFPPMPTALTNYLSLTDAQIAAIENAIFGNRDYNARQQLKIQELQIEIKDLTAAQTIDSGRLGADYVAIDQIQRDGAKQVLQLTESVRSMLNEKQKPLLEALDQAAGLSYVADQAVSANILVLPPDLQGASWCLSGYFKFTGYPVFPGSCSGIGLL